MTNSISSYLSSIAELTDRTVYEAYLLEAVYRIVGNPFETLGVDDIVFSPDGQPPTQFIHGMATIELGDWRPAFLDIGAPLIFSTGFKLLDMIMEWVLAQNGYLPDFRFQQKIKRMKGQITFPPILAARPWLCERLIALYENLEPLRGTLIHERHFTSTGGVLRISSSKGGVVGPAVPVTQEDLRNLSLLFVLLVRCLEGVWNLDTFVEKRIRYLLDEVAPFHKLPLLGQTMPSYRRARIYVRDEDPIVVDLEKIRTAALWGRQGQEVVYDLRIVGISHDGSKVTTYMVRYDELLSSGSQLVRTRAELERSLEPIVNGDLKFPIFGETEFPRPAVL